MANVDKKELWIEYTHDALGAISLPELEEGFEPDDVADDLHDIATKYADSMLDSFEEKFESGSRGSSRRKRGKRRTRDDDEPPESEP